METIEQLIESASHDMFNPVINFEIAKKYHEIGQTASATSFYLRCAEYGHDTTPLHVYSSLIKIAECLSDQTGRENTVKNCFLQAIQYLPKRPEAYFLLSRYYEQKSSWQEAYTFAQVGLTYVDCSEPLPTKTDYLGEFVLLFEKAVAGWWIGRLEESISLFSDLLELDIPDNYRKSIEYNLGKIQPNNDSQG
jgi:tetratricopeptide (TPR) repeat protein